MIPINYVEFKCHDIDVIKEFYTKTFGWKFVDYGEKYTAFSDSGIEGGFELTDEPIACSVLVVMHAEELDVVQANVMKNGGTISKETFSFPGGERFEFIDPSGNQLAVWTDLSGKS